jgi:holo-[acyl-carrier protein] synthase
LDEGSEMIFGIGIDLIEVNRIERAMAKNSSFKTRMYSQAEIAYCDSVASSIQSYAARFAAKEAFMKALGTGWADEISWSEIEILREESGRPILNLLGRTREIADTLGIQRSFVSLTHLKEYAAAVVTLEI